MRSISFQRSPPVDVSRVANTLCLGYTSLTMRNGSIPKRLRREGRTVFLPCLVVLSAIIMALSPFLWAQEESGEEPRAWEQEVQPWEEQTWASPGTVGDAGQDEAGKREDWQETEAEPTGAEEANPGALSPEELARYEELLTPRTSGLSTRDRSAGRWDEKQDVLVRSEGRRTRAEGLWDRSLNRPDITELRWAREDEQDRTGRRWVRIETEEDRTEGRWQAGS